MIRYHMNKKKNKTKSNNALLLVIQFVVKYEKL